MSFQSPVLLPLNVNNSHAHARVEARLCFSGGLSIGAFTYRLCGFSKILIKTKNVGVSISAAASEQTAELNRILTNTRGPHKESESDAEAFGPGVDYTNIRPHPRSPQMNINTHTHLGANTNSYVLCSNILMEDDVSV